MAPVKRDLPDPYARPFVSIAEAATYLGMGRSTAFRAADDGRLPTVTISRTRRVPTVALYRMAGRTVPEPANRPHPAVSAG